MPYWVQGRHPKRGYLSYTCCKAECYCGACADPGRRGHLEKSQKIKDFLAILVRTPEKSQSYQASTQCWVIIGTPAKRYLNSVSLVSR